MVCFAWGPSTAWRRLRVARWRLQRWLRPAEFTLARRFGLATRDDRVFFLLILLVGVLAGFLGTAIHRLIEGLQALLWGRGGSIVDAAATVPPWRVVGALAVGGIAVGVVAWLARVPPAGGGGGMAMLIESVALSGGKVPVRPVLARALAAVATVGSGGSLGREGPMIRLGAMISSQVASRLGLSPHRVKVLVGCGAAAGLAAAYNIPVGGALFAMEVILGNFALEIFGPIVVSSVISTLIARATHGDAPIYAAEGYRLVSLWEVPAYLGLGILGALFSLLFIFVVGAGNRLFRRLTFLPPPLKPILGMPLVGAAGLLAPQVLGGGYATISEALAGGMAVKLLLFLAAMKLVATALTAGCGASGGLFTPSLFMGAVVGGAYGHGVAALVPAAAPGAYAVVGMAAVAAGTSHAPLTAILILFEFTGNYDLILPLMLASITASMLARQLYPHSIYTESLQRRGVELPWRMEEAVLAGLKVGDLMRADSQVLAPGDPYPKVVETFLASRRQRLFVVDGERRLLGTVSLHDIKHVLEQPATTLTAVVAHDLLTPAGTVLAADERLHRAAEVLAKSDFERMPVVESDGRYAGVLAKRDLLAVYAQEVLGRPALLATFVSGGETEASRDYVELPPDFQIRLAPVPEELVGKTLAAARLPQRAGIRVIEIKREAPGGETRRVIAGGETLLRRGDLLIVMGPSAQVEALERGELAPSEAEAHQAID